MSRTQIRPTDVTSTKNQMKRLNRLERTASAPRLPDIATAGLTSAQIDASAFGGQQEPYDGAQIIDSASTKLLTRIAGHWWASTLTEIT